jgi:hypothetical protein
MAMTIHGVALRPGVSRNRRRYTPEMCSKAYDRISERLDDMAGRPLTMRTAHPDPSGQGAVVTSIVGHVTKAWLTSDKAIAYEALLADTPEGKTVQQLVKPAADGRAHLANVSIRGYFLGETRQDPDGCVTADDLEIDGLDLTDTPGMTTASVAPGASESVQSTPIFESVEEAFVDTTTSTIYADLGFTAAGQRLPITTEADIRTSWAAINETADGYTRKQAGRIRGRIRAAARESGINLATEATDSAVKQIIEGYAAMLPEPMRPKFIEEAYACVSVGDGAASVDASCYGNDPADLQAVIGRLAAAVVAALDEIDPNGDGQIDLPEETAPTGSANESARPAANGKEPTMGSETQPAAGTTEAATTPEPLTTESLKTALAETMGPIAEALAKVLTPAAPAGAAPAAAAAETAPAAGAATATETAAAAATETAPAGPVTEADLREKIRAELLQEARAGITGPGGTAPERKGLVKDITEESFDLSSLPKAQRDALVGEAYVKKLFPALYADLAAD